MDAACNGVVKRISGNFIWREQRSSCICWVDFYGRHHNKSQEGTHFNSRQYFAAKFVHPTCKVLPQSVWYYVNGTTWWWCYHLQTLVHHTSEASSLIRNFFNEKITCIIQVIVQVFRFEFSDHLSCTSPQTVKNKYVFWITEMRSMWLLTV